MNLVDVLDKNSRLYPSDPAFVEVKPLSKEREEINWKQFNDRTSRLANALLHRKISKGDKVFLLGKNSINWIEAYFAVMKTGAWVVPLNFRFTDDDIEYCAKVAEPAAFILADEFGKRMNHIRPNLPTVKKYVSIGRESLEGMENMEDLIQKSSPESPGVELGDQDACGLYFTSGTTGAPKPVLVTHLNLMCAVISEATNHYLEQDDSLLMMPPLYHLAIGHLLGLMLVGGRTVLLTEKVSPKLIIENISGECISVVFLLVPWALDLIEALDKGVIKKKDHDLSSWRLTHMGAQPIPPSLVHRL